MGTYDTRSGSAVSPPDDEPYIFEEENNVLDILESAGVPTETNDKVLAIVRTLCERNSKSEEWRNAIKQALIAEGAEFSSKVIQGGGEPFQLWRASLLIEIPVKHSIVNERFENTEEPSMSFESAIDKWLSEIDAGNTTLDSSTT